MKKILFVHPNLIARGAEKVLVDLLNELDQTKYDVTLYTFFEEGIHKERLSKGVKHIFLFKKIFRGWSVFQKIFSPKQLFKFLIKDEYDVIVAYLEGVPTRVVSGCTKPTTKIISWVHVDLSNFGIEKVFRGKKEMKQCYHKFDKVVGVSKTAIHSLKEMISLPSEKAMVIHNVVDTAAIIKSGNETVDDIKWSTKGITICSVGSLTRQKGYPRLLSIVKKLKQEGYDFHLYLIGTGEDKERLETYIAANSLDSHVTLLGFRANPHKYVKNCDLFVCSSFEEGFSTAVTEAVVLETPVITTDCSGMDEILEDGAYGMIVPNNESALYRGLQQLIEDEKLFLSYKNKAKERSLYFQQKNNAADVEALFDAL